MCWKRLTQCLKYVLHKCIDELPLSKLPEHKGFSAQAENSWCMISCGSAQAGNRASKSSYREQCGDNSSRTASAMRPLLQQASATSPHTF